MFGADLAILSPSSHVNATLITIRLQFDNENGRRVYKGEENWKAEEEGERAAAEAAVEEQEEEEEEEDKNVCLILPREIPCLKEKAKAKEEEQEEEDKTSNHTTDYQKKEKKKKHKKKQPKNWPFFFLRRKYFGQVTGVVVSHQNHQTHQKHQMVIISNHPPIHQ